MNGDAFGYTPLSFSPAKKLCSSTKYLVSCVNCLTDPSYRLSYDTNASSGNSTASLHLERATSRTCTWGGINDSCEPGASSASRATCLPARQPSSSADHGGLCGYPVPL